ncbi:hypothetical protein CC80DRAFT_30483 [Byssothecium circinans]|uniref:Uncharacterized protein n=1 Tax=Byssothecium circinans TaxID=147558 RepID=A0A6A5U3K5_9PLEO|nr:hypothetical protein CC80DRAFT_30483 [Byssothecium circinans]
MNALMRQRVVCFYSYGLTFFICRYWQGRVSRLLPSFLPSPIERWRHSCVCLYRVAEYCGCWDCLM